MKKILLFATAVAGFAMSAMAQEGSIKTTTVQYSVPTCTNCRTTTTVATTYPEIYVQQPVAVQEVEARPVVMKRTVEEKKCIVCKENNELGIRNPLFVLKQGQFSFQNVTGFFREPKHDSKNGGTYMENHGWQWTDTLSVGITDRFYVSIFGGHHHAMPKTNQWHRYQEQQRKKNPQHLTERVIHTDRYDVTGGLYYHLLDFCHFDAIIGYEHSWGRVKTTSGVKGAKTKRDRTNSLLAGPTVTLGSTWGWFTPNITMAYRWTGVHTYKKDSKKKKWDKDEVYYLVPGVYIQPSKYYAFDFSWEKTEHQDAQWNLGVDFYPYKNIVLGAQLNASRPTKDPMKMMGVSVAGKIVF